MEDNNKTFDDKSVALMKLTKLTVELNVTYKHKYGKYSDKSFLNYLNSVMTNPESVKIQPMGLFVKIVETLLENNVNYSFSTYLDAIQKAEEIYPAMFPYGEETPDFPMLALAYIGFFKAHGLAAKGLYDQTLMSTFKYKHNYVNYMNTIKNDKEFLSNLHPITQHSLSVRAFFLDDETYTAHMIYITAKLLNTQDKTALLNEERKKVEHMAGIYNIDEADVARTEQQLIQASSMLKNTVGILEQADQKTDQLNRIMKDTTETIQEIAKRETDFLTLKANTAREDINAAYNGFLEEQRQEILVQKNVLLGQIFNEAEAKLNELRTMSRALTASANSELLRINTETSNAMEKINNLVSNDEEIQKILSKADENKELFDKIAKLEILNNQNIEAIANGLASQYSTSGSANPAADKQNASQMPVKVVVSDSANSTLPVAEFSPTESDPQSIPEVNPFFDKKIPFERRFKRVMEEKQKRIANGEHFHTMFNDVVTILMEDANPYLIGPSGCGKTYMVKQIASILNLDFIDIGYINEEYDILGFKTATGAYSTTNFYRCYKYGKMAFCDEFDNGNSRATVKLNSFLSNNKDAYYSFPNGENVKRHSNFRIIAAGNTAGNGADANYNTREKIEESVQQRFTPIYVGYDNAVEREILANYKDWYQFIVLFRMATDAWGNQNDCSAPGIITTRDAARIKTYLDNKSLDAKKIINYEFIQTKDMEYLAFLSNYMGKHVDSYSKAKSLYEIFDLSVTALREKGGVR